MHFLVLFPQPCDLFLLSSDYPLDGLASSAWDALLTLEGHFQLTVLVGYHVQEPLQLQILLEEPLSPWYDEIGILQSATKTRRPQQGKSFESGREELKGNGDVSLLIQGGAFIMEMD